ncbi:MAG: CBS domain-containing protein, partial [Thermoplasmatales archaeon]
MTTPPITLKKDVTLAAAKALMRDHKISGIPIVDERGVLIGIISIENIIIALEKGYINDPIEKHMVKKVVYLYNDMAVSTAMGFLMNHDFGRYPVINRDQMVVGIVTKADLMQHMYERLGQIYMHNKRRDQVLTPVDFLIDQETPESKEYRDRLFSYTIENQDLDNAGQGSTQFKKFLQERNFPPDATRRASIALYEAEVNVVLHAKGKGLIKAFLEKNQIYIVIVDSGPGIDDIDLAIQPGYTTATDEVREKGFGAGMGLANIIK